MLSHRKMRRRSKILREGYKKQNSGIIFSPKVNLKKIIKNAKAANPLTAFLIKEV